MNTCKYVMMHFTFIGYWKSIQDLINLFQARINSTLFNVTSEHSISTIVLKVQFPIFHDDRNIFYLFLKLPAPPLPNLLSADVLDSLIESWSIKSLSCVQLFATPWTGQVPLPTEFSRQE